MVGIVGPDGVGKSTLLALVAGSKKLQEGKITVLDGDIERRPTSTVLYVRKSRICLRVFGKNLYLELSVYDNVDFMAQLFGLSPWSVRFALSNCSMPLDLPV